MTHRVSTPSISRTVAFVAAGLLIFLGVVFQLGRFLGSLSNASNDWLIHMIAMNVWNAIMLRLDVLGFGPVLHFWPLLLVGLGLATMVALEPIRSVVAQAIPLPQ